MGNVTILTRKLLILAVTCCFSVSAWSHDLTGKWDLKIEDKNHQLVATLVVKFASQRARSCVSGDWKRVLVVSATTKDKHFFPVSDPLSFEIENDRMTIGRNEICDAYLMLSGPLSSEGVAGEYYSLGLEGSSPLGAFTLSRKR